MKTMQRRKPYRWGSKPFATRRDLFAKLRIDVVREIYTELGLMETRASLQRQFRRKA